MECTKEIDQFFVRTELAFDNNNVESLIYQIRSEYPRCPVRYVPTVRTEALSGMAHRVDEIYVYDRYPLVRLLQVIGDQ